MNAAVAPTGDDATAGWLAATQDRHLAPAISVDLWFECRDPEPWTHVCRIRGGQVVEWQPDVSARPCIRHPAAAMDDLLAGRCGLLDPRWEVVATAFGPAHPLPPHDLAELVIDVTDLDLAPDLDLAWVTVCRAANGEEVAYVSELRGGRAVHHRPALPGDLGTAPAGTAGTAPAATSGPSPAPVTVLVVAVEDLLRLRAGGSVMPTFDGGGVDGALDELLFLAGLLDSPTWRAAWAVDDATLWRVQDHVRLFSGLALPRGAA